MSSRDDSEEKAERRGSRTITKQLAIGFGGVSVVSVLMCFVLLLQLQRAGAAVHEMRADEAAIRESAELATAIREQYVHLAHAVIEGDGSHLDHQADWTAQVFDRVESLRPGVSPRHWVLLDGIEANSARVAELVEERVLPSLTPGSGELAEVHGEIESLIEEASAQADDLALMVGNRMVGAHIDANRAARVGVVSGLFCVAAILALSAFFTVRLRTSVIGPLATLAEAAGELGSGNFDVRLGRIGHGELQTVAFAFDHMVEELADREQQLMRSERMAAIGQLAAGVAHELNNPIGIIRGYLKTIDLDGDLEEVRRELGIVDEEAVACQRIAEDLLAYASTPRLELRSARIHEVLQETAARLVNAGLSTARSITVEADPAVVEIDPARVRQVLSNLLRNAVQASEPGSPVAVEGRVLPGAYEVRVVDRGSGIPPEDRMRVFEPFFSKRGGSGLGLAVVHGLVAAHDGTIRVEPRDGGGTAFVVVLPRHDAAAAKLPEGNA